MTYQQLRERRFCYKSVNQVSKLPKTCINELTTHLQLWSYGEKRHSLWRFLGGDPTPVVSSLDLPGIKPVVLFGMSNTKLYPSDNPMVTYFLQLRLVLISNKPHFHPVLPPNRPHNLHDKLLFRGVKPRDDVTNLANHRTSIARVNSNWHQHIESWLNQLRFHNIAQNHRHRVWHDLFWASSQND